MQRTNDRRRAERLRTVSQTTVYMGFHVRRRNMNRAKYLIKNTAILLISKFSSKILVFFLLPLYTSVLTTEEYGISDLITTTVHILFIFLTLYISHGIIRFTMNKASDADEMLSIGIGVTIISTVVVGIGSFVAFIANLLPSMNPYYGYLVATYVFYCLGTVLTAFSKGREKIRLIGIAGVVSTAVRIATNILLLVVFPLGIRGYLLSAVLSNAAQCVVYAAGGLLKGTKLKKPNKGDVLKLIKYSAPIAGEEVGWLICTSSDKYIVSWMLDTSAVGLISAAHRLTAVLTAFTSVFIQAWTLSAIKESENADKSAYYTRMFNCYNAFAITAGAILILSAKVIGAFLFRGEFHGAWIYTPIYLTALVINTMSSFSGSIIAAGTDTKPLFISTTAGAVLNLVLDVILIKFIGLYGAGIATALSFLLIGTMRMKTVRKDFDLRIDYKRMISSIVVLCILTATMIFADHVIYYTISAALTVVIILINRHMLIDIAKMLLRLLKNTAKKRS